MNNLSFYLKKLLNFTISFFSGLLIITYLLNVPHMLTENKKIVNEYYLKNYITNVPLDYIFVLLYYLVAFVIMNILKIKKNYQKVIILGLVTGILTYIFLIYFTSKKQTSNFFSKWFHTVGYSSILYDVILLVFIYLIYLFIDERINY